jgi:hypothetical protein
MRLLAATAARLLGPLQRRVCWGRLRCCSRILAADEGQGELLRGEV